MVYNQKDLDAPQFTDTSNQIMQIPWNQTVKLHTPSDINRWMQIRQLYKNQQNKLTNLVGFSRKY